jgi:hypothetical protein
MPAVETPWCRYLNALSSLSIGRTTTSRHIGCSMTSNSPGTTTPDVNSPSRLLMCQRAWTYLPCFIHLSWPLAGGGIIRRHRASTLRANVINELCQRPQKDGLFTCNAPANRLFICLQTKSAKYLPARSASSDRSKNTGKTKSRRNRESYFHTF